MNFSRHVSRTLDDEHRSNLELLGKVEAACTRGGDAALAGLAPALLRQLETDVGRHFDFEERELFGRLAEVGDRDIVALLTEEHQAIRAVAAELKPLLHAAASGSLDRAGWAGLRSGTLELIERQVAHIQKETMGLLPMLEDLLDEETDRALALEYAAH